MHNAGWFSLAAAPLAALLACSACAWLACLRCRCCCFCVPPLYICKSMHIHVCVMVERCRNAASLSRIGSFQAGKHRVNLYTHRLSAFLCLTLRHQSGLASFGSWNSFWGPPRVGSSVAPHCVPRFFAPILPRESVRRNPGLLRVSGLIRITGFFSSCWMLGVSVAIGRWSNNSINSNRSRNLSLVSLHMSRACVRSVFRFAFSMNRSLLS